MTHGQRRAAGNKPTATYNSWSNMRKRCDNPHNKSYPDYGGRARKSFEVLKRGA